MDFPVRTVFTAVQPVQQMAGGDVLPTTTKRIHPSRKVEDWEVAANPKVYSSVLLTGRGWAETRSMAMEALGKWQEVDSSLRCIWCHREEELRRRWKRRWPRFGPGGPMCGARW